MGLTARISTIDSLFFRCGPLAICWFVVAIVIDSFDAMSSAWAQSHIKQKMLKFAPPLTNLDSSTAPVFIARCRLTVTPAPQSLPGAIFRRMPHAMGFCCENFLNQTTATFRMIAFQGIGPDFDLCATNTNAPPKGPFISSSKVTNCKAVKLSANKILDVFSHFS